MKFNQSVVEPREAGSKFWQGSSKPIRSNFSSTSVRSLLRQATCVLLTACLPLGGVAFAATPAASLAQESHRLFVSGEEDAARTKLQQATAVDRNDSSVIFEQALLDDAAGRHNQARKGYDRLQAGPLSKAAAVPSAVNLVAVDRFDQARKAFATLATSQDVYEAGYSQLWQLWLTARTYKGNSAALRATLANAAAEVKAATPQQRALAKLYAGKGSVDAVFSAIDGMGLVDPLQRRDARTEAAFFAGGYLQYVRRDHPAALRLYKRELSQPTASIERPLLEKAIAKRPRPSR
ncbi:hypothetical protein JVX91_19460 [Pseudomonas sp. PDNC002]|uniref:hypothetical protein n=1 Tax=Pseudomonas sp. PDNC002 TaxID=2811422 RepID=UPI0019667E7A|nr:hypothetical protein [Pseudomonas sp. PDNC002]QRY77767.1 hypothetical protein JVX91_19460 [Pseudomonas sp. PDNC002]